eukprot:scaffold278235_cov40-Attheya_sp.AAC.2
MSAQCSISSSPQTLLPFSEYNEKGIRDRTYHESKQIVTTPLLPSSEHNELEIRDGMNHKSKQKPNTTLRVVDDTLSVPVTHNFVLVFESVPVWLFSLDREICSRVSFYGHDSSSDLLGWCADNAVETTLPNIMSSRLGVSRISFIREGGDIPPNSIVLVSGSVDYLNAQELILPASVPCLFLVDAHVRSKRIPTSQNLDWHRLRHK